MKILTITNSFLKFSNQNFKFNLKNFRKQVVIVNFYMSTSIHESFNYNNLFFKIF